MNFMRAMFGFILCFIPFGFVLATASLKNDAWFGFYILGMVLFSVGCIFSGAWLIAEWLENGK